MMMLMDLLINSILLPFLHLVRKNPFYLISVSFSLPRSTPGRESTSIFRIPLDCSITIYLDCSHFIQIGNIRSSYLRSWSQYVSMMPLPFIWRPNSNPNDDDDDHGLLVSDRNGGALARQNVTLPYAADIFAYYFYWWWANDEEQRLCQGPIWAWHHHHNWCWMI